MQSPLPNLLRWLDALDQIGPATNRQLSTFLGCGTPNTYRWMSLLKKWGLVHSYTEKNFAFARRPHIYGLTVAGARYLAAVRQCEAILRDPDRSESLRLRHTPAGES